MWDLNRCILFNEQSGIKRQEFVIDGTQMLISNWDGSKSMNEL